MAASLPRPMRSGASASSARVPGFSPSTTTRWVGAPRWGFLAALPLRRSGTGAPPRAISGTRAPNMSERMTEIADSTKIQRIARNAARMRKRVSSDIPASGLVASAVDPDGHLGVPDLDRGAVAQPGPADLRPVDEDAVGGAEVHGLDAVDGDLELDVAPAHARVVDPEVGLGAATDHQAGRAQRVARAVDLERRVGGPAAGALVVVGDAGLRLAADPEAAGGEVVRLLEGDRDRPGEDVALRVGVVLQLVDEVLLERSAEAEHPLEVGRRQLDVEVVGHQPALAAHHLCVVVALALEGRGDLDRLHRAAEGPGEDAGDHGLEPLLEALQGVHARPPLLTRSGGQASHAARSVPASVPAGRRRATMPPRRRSYGSPLPACGWRHPTSRGPWVAAYDIRVGPIDVACRHGRRRCRRVPPGW